MSNYRLDDKMNPKATCKLWKCKIELQFWGQGIFGSGGDVSVAVGFVATGTDLIQALFYLIMSSLRILSLLQLGVTFSIKA